MTQLRRVCVLFLFSLLTSVVVLPLEATQSEQGDQQKMPPGWTGSYDVSAIWEAELPHFVSKV